MQSTMTHRRHLLAAILCGATMSLACTHVAAQTSPANEVAAHALAKRGTAPARAAAERDLARFVAHQQQTRSIGSAADSPFDVAHPKDLLNARIGYGFAVYTVDPADLLSGRGGMQQMAKPTGQWRFVVMLGDKAIGLATVEQNNAAYETTAYGGALLAKDVESLMSRHGNKDKSNLRFLRIYQARADLLEVSGQNDGAVRFAPLHSARQSLGMQTSDTMAARTEKAAAPLLDESEMLQALRSAVKTNLDASR